MNTSSLKFPAAFPFLLILILGIARAAADAPERICIEAETCIFVFNPKTSALDVGLEEKTIPLLRGVGPVWRMEGGERSPLTAQVDILEARQEEGGWALNCAARPEGVRWRTALRRGDQGELVIELQAEQEAIVKAQPGMVVAGGEWIGLDLSQYQLAHGQTNWPKTYYLRRHDLFLCAWWDLEVSNASSAEWNPKDCDPRRGERPFAPAAEMAYPAGPDGKRAALHEALHLRVARRLWDAALPSLCLPSEYRNELAEMVYLDLWGNSTAAELKHVLGCLEELAGPHVRFLTILQNWQAGGFDVLLPDSIWLPDYPPNPALGTVEEFRELADLGKRLGCFGFRTNYALCQDQSPSVKRGLVARATGPDGKAKWHTQPGRWNDLAQRQEREIAQLWHPTANFTDQLASGGSPAAYCDFSRPAGGDGTLATTLRYQRELARLIKKIHNGPLGSETLNQQDLIGRFCDFGDYGVLNGHNRLFPPDYKLRRMHTLTMFYGCGLCYRFFEPPPFKQFHARTLPLWKDPSLMDDYRCCEAILGNGGYIFYEAPWAWILTESILMGRLQRHYALTPVESVDYLCGGEWRSLESLVRDGFAPQTRPWLQKQPELGRIRVRYANGLTVCANRLPEDLPVDTPEGAITLPQYGWVAFQADGSVLAYSAFLPGTRQRVDSLQEHSSKLRFLNPRGASVEGSDDVRLWKEGQLLWSLDPDTETAVASGRRLELRPRVRPLTELNLEFTRGLCGCRPVRGILRVEASPEGQRLEIVSTDPYLFLPPVEIEGRSEDVVELALSASAGTMGQFYFSTQEGGLHMIPFDVQADGRPHTVLIPVGRHPRWPGSRIVFLRLDPIHGAAPASVVLHSLRLKREDIPRR